jgi:5-hydroxyisourate hydrolase
MISSHVLDTSLGVPARGVAVHLDVLEPEGTWRRIGTACTNDDGRASALGQAGELGGRTCRLSFDIGPYFAASQRPVFFPRVEVIFVVAGNTTRLHLPLLLSPYGYSVYRGS